MTLIKQLTLKGNEKTYWKWVRIVYNSWANLWKTATIKLVITEHQQRNATLWTKKHVNSTWRHPEFSHRFRLLTLHKQNCYQYFQVHRAQYRLEVSLFEQYWLLKCSQILPLLQKGESQNDLFHFSLTGVRVTVLELIKNTQKAVCISRNGCLLLNH